MWDFTKTRPTLETLHGAIQEAVAGGQGLMVHKRIPVLSAPSCFEQSPVWGKLYDQDAQRLVNTARVLGVNRVVVHHQGASRQHVDLCGEPLRRAMARAQAALPLLEAANG